MSMLGSQCDELREVARNMQGKRGRCLYRRKDVDEMQQVSGMLFEAANTIEGLRDKFVLQNENGILYGREQIEALEAKWKAEDGLQKENDALRDYRASQIAAEAERRLQESYGQVSEQGEREDEGERESCGEVCGDDRFELIGKAKRKLLECTNIESRPEEVAVLDSILFRCWQMGLLDQLREDNSCAECAEGMGRYADSLCDPLKQRIAELEGQRDVLLRCLENDYGIKASWDGLRKLWFTESATSELDYAEDKSRWAELFGTPERAARTLITVRKECEDVGTCYPNCPFRDAPACPSDVEPRDQDALLEWLKGEDEVIDEPDTIRNELADGGLIADVLAPVCVDEKERRAFERGRVHERFAQQIFKEAGMRGDA